MLVRRPRQFAAGVYPVTETLSLCGDEIAAEEYSLTLSGEKGAELRGTYDIPAKLFKKVEGKEYYYTYDFYKIDDHRVMISLYRSDADGNKIEHLGEVSDFYITTFAFKKLVNNYVHLLNGMKVDESVDYPA